jgi:hypothetical protein
LALLNEPRQLIEKCISILLTAMLYFFTHTAIAFLWVKLFYLVKPYTCFLPVTTSWIKLFL